jgi:hypothetical protein
VATFFESLFLVSYHQKFTAVHNNASFLLLTSLISCIPYFCSQNFLIISNERFQVSHVCIWWEPWPFYHNKLNISWFSNRNHAKFIHSYILGTIDAPPHSLKDLNVSLKMKTIEKRVSVTLFSSQYFGGKRGVLELWD